MNQMLIIPLEWSVCAGFTEQVKKRSDGHHGTQTDKDEFGIQLFKEFKKYGLTHTEGQNNEQNAE